MYILYLIGDDEFVTLAVSKEVDKLKSCPQLTAYMNRTNPMNNLTADSLEWKNPKDIHDWPAEELAIGVARWGDWQEFVIAPIEVVE